MLHKEQHSITPLPPLLGERNLGLSVGISRTVRAETSLETAIRQQTERESSSYFYYIDDTSNQLNLLPEGDHKLTERAINYR